MQPTEPIQSAITQERIESAVRLRYSPFPELKMEILAQQLNQFRIGELRPAARTWEIMLERDGDLSSPAIQRFADAARLPWIIEKDDDSEEAQQDYDALMYFYTHLTATSVLDQDEVGGVNLLFRQMMTAKAYRYSVHETLLRVNNAGKREVTAQFNHCPVWFFEARKGRLAFLRNDLDFYGEPLERGRWLTAIERFPAMPACSVGYLTKWGPLSDWMLFCSRFGLPGIQGLIDAAPGSTEWNEFAAALKVFANDWITLTNRSAEIKLIEAAKGGSGTLPFQDLVERSDRMFARMFRGGDLSTQSREGGDVSGASLQGGESSIKQEDDAQWLTDNCNAGIDEPVIGYIFNREPKAWLRVQTPKKPDTDREVKAMEFLSKNGGRVALKAAHDRLQIPMAEEKEDVLTPPSPNSHLPSADPVPLGNAAESNVVIAQAVAEDLQPLLAAMDTELDAILSISDPALRLAKFNALWERLAPLRADILKVPATAHALEKITARAFAAGVETKKANVTTA